ncbi:hypothetical protein [Vallicoccus soli]|uniref:TFIIS-type domain-containing protein n=1 Tax=Vallicoccus soli TaxID=2339232 RepID=A0A3A3Z4A5_9ACTN|nr:hypothetical protein [Vallicoccus soli]RJK95377.1 hypothetical protein D5H78_11995 [Vallicoccus soli]
MARRTRTVKPEQPLGSLLQAPAAERGSCAACGSESVTRLAMDLTDGTPVTFVSCHRCERRSWTAPDGSELPVASVLERTRKRT